MHIRSFLERNEMLRGGAAAQTSASDGATPRHGSGDLTMRLDNREWFSGNTIAVNVLPKLGLTFDDLKRWYNEYGKPPLDLGASYSTVALEGAFRGIPIHSTDLRCDSNRPGFMENIRQSASNLGPLYDSPEILPAGFGCTRISPSDWQSCLEHGLSQVSSRMAQCSATSITLPNGERAPDRYFSVVVSHNAVPLYSDKREFFDAELPEILRVADRQVSLFPFMLSGGSHEALHLPGSTNRQSVERLAQQHGFSVQITPCPGGFGTHEALNAMLGNDQLAILTRHR